MNIKTRLLGVLLALLMLFSATLSVTAFPDVKPDGDYSKAIGLLSRIGIVGGYEDGTFQPEKNVSRAEMAKLVYVLYTTVNATDASGSVFTDVPDSHWAQGFVKWCAERNIIGGFGDGTFRPNDNVTYDQALKMVCGALGYTDWDSSKWPADVRTKALSHLNLGSGIYGVGGSDALTREEVSQLIYNALFVRMNEKVEGTDTAKVLAYDMWRMVKSEELVTATFALNLGGFETTKSENEITVGTETYTLEELGIDGYLGKTDQLIGRTLKTLKMNGEILPITTLKDTMVSNEAKIAVTAPVGEVFPYIEKAKQYLKSGKNVSKYAVSVDNPQVPIEIKWVSSCGADEFIVEYSTSPDYADSIKVTAGKNDRLTGVYNLYKGTEYFVKVTAVKNGEALAFAEGRFTTTALGPRVMNVDGVYNVRDLGGYKTENGETTRQGMIYRGAGLWDKLGRLEELSSQAKKDLSQVLKIKTHIDIRGSEQAGGRAMTTIPGANLVYVTILDYVRAFEDTEPYRQFFSHLANENNYPIYFNCYGGADRTGTLAFLVNALLGVPEKELIQDYEFTTFSWAGQRNAEGTVYEFGPFLERLKSFEGETLKDKTESYMLSIGVTPEEIASIRSILIEK